MRQPDAEKHPMKFMSLHLDTDRILGLSAMLIGIGSLFVILYQTHLMRQSQHASVMPYLMIGFTSNSGGVHVNLRNSGIGPALIDDVRIRHATGEKATDPYAFFLEGDANRRKLPLTVDSAVAGRLIPAGEGIQMVGLDAQFLTDETRGIIYKDLLRTFALAEVPRNWYEGVGLAPADPRRAVIEVVYSSIYGDRWRIRSNSYVPEPF
jgi:hypothetical protein